jgi:uncharacterized protein YjbI with pentapeptide repeats
MSTSPSNESVGVAYGAESNGGEIPLKPEFSHATLRGKDFSDCNLAGSIFDGCDLADSNFTRANLDRSTFSGCGLVGARFFRAALRGGKFSDCTGLTIQQFAGAHLEGAILPESIAKPIALSRISEISKRAYTLLCLILGASLTSALVISQTSDISLLANIGSLALPGTAIKAPTATFFIVMPAIIAALWLFLQLTLLHLWQEFADLPAVFPDGEARHRKTDQWLLGAYVWSLSDEVSFAGTDLLKLLVFQILVWWLVPCVLVSFWMSFLRRHDMTGSCLQIAIISIIALFGAYAGRRARSVFRRDSIVRESKHLAVAFKTIVAAILILLLLSNAAVNGVSDGGPMSLGDHDAWYRRIGQGMLSHLPIKTHPALREIKLDDDQKSLNQADIKYADAFGLIAPSVNLQNAILTGTFLSNAVLTDAHLEGANLEYSGLSDAHFNRAFLQGAHFELSEARDAQFNGAHLEFAHLIEADLNGADFSDASLLDTDFRGADLRKAKFRGSSLQDVDFYMADLRGADFTGARDVDGIKCLSRANVNGAIGLAVSENAEGFDPKDGKFAVINESSDDEYRRALAKSLRDGNAPCGFISIAGWRIDGPPSYAVVTVEPRSLRFFAIQWPQELPRQMRKDISTFIDAASGSNTRDFESAFNNAKARLRYAPTQGFPDAHYASSSGSSSEFGSLMGYQIECGGNTKGFELSLSFEGYSLRPNRSDIDQFIDEKLGRGEEFGTEEHWQLPGNGAGFIIERLNSEGERITYTTCLTLDEVGR